MDYKTVSKGNTNKGTSSGSCNKEYRDNQLGGIPAKKNREEIEVATRPQHLGKAPGSCGI